MFRFFITILIVVALPNLALSQVPLEEFRDAKAKLSIPDEPNLLGSFLADLHYEMLMGLVANSTWFGLTSAESDQQIADTCAKKPIAFNRISEFSFSRDSQFFTSRLRDIYIRKYGVEYAVRRDFETKIEYYSKGEQNLKNAVLPSVLASANSTSVFLTLSQNVLLEIDGGRPTLYGRCSEGKQVPAKVEEFSSAKQQIYGSLQPGDQTSWDEKRNRDLLNRVAGQWITLNATNLKDANDVTKACTKPKFKFELVNGYSFARISSIGAETARDIYMWKTGLAYNVRQDTDAFIRDENKRDSAPPDKFIDEDTPLLSNANREATLILPSTNVLLEIVNGNEILYGRCNS